MTYEETPAPEIKKRRGCFFYGCLSVVVLLFIVGIMARYGSRAIHLEKGELTD